MKGCEDMFVLQNEKGKWPIKVWLDSEKDIEESCELYLIL